MSSICFTSCYLYVYNIYLISACILILSVAQIAICGTINSLTHDGFCYEYVVGILSLLVAFRSVVAYKSNKYAYDSEEDVRRHRLTVLYLLGTVLLACIGSGVSVAVYGSQYSHYEHIKACVSNTPSGLSSNCAGITPYDCYGDVTYYETAGECHQSSLNTQCSCVADSGTKACYTFNSVHDGCSYLVDSLGGSYYNAHSMSIVCLISLIVYTLVLLFIYVQMTLHKRSVGFSLYKQSLLGDFSTTQSEKDKDGYYLSNSDEIVISPGRSTSPDKIKFINKDTRSSSDTETNNNSTGRPSFTASPYFKQPNYTNLTDSSPNQIKKRTSGTSPSTATTSTASAATASPNKEDDNYVLLMDDSIPPPPSSIKNDRGESAEVVVSPMRMFENLRPLPNAHTNDPSINPNSNSNANQKSKIEERRQMFDKKQTSVPMPAASVSSPARAKLTQKTTNSNVTGNTNANSKVQPQARPPSITSREDGLMYTPNSLSEEDDVMAGINTSPSPSTLSIGTTQPFPSIQPNQPNTTSSSHQPYTHQTQAPTQAHASMQNIVSMKVPASTPLAPPFKNMDMERYYPSIDILRQDHPVNRMSSLPDDLMQEDLTDLTSDDIRSSITGTTDLRTNPNTLKKKSLPPGRLEPPRQPVNKPAEKNVANIKRSDNPTNYKNLISKFETPVVVAPPAAIPDQQEISMSPSVTTAYGGTGTTSNNHTPVLTEDNEEDSLMIPANIPPSHAKVLSNPIITTSNSKSGYTQGHVHAYSRGYDEMDESSDNRESIVIKSAPPSRPTASKSATSSTSEKPPLESSSKPSKPSSSQPQQSSSKPLNDPMPLHAHVSAEPVPSVSSSIPSIPKFTHEIKVPIASVIRDSVGGNDNLPESLREEPTSSHSIQPINIGNINTTGGLNADDIVDQPPGTTRVNNHRLGGGLPAKISAAEMDAMMSISESSPSYTRTSSTSGSNLQETPERTRKSLADERPPSSAFTNYSEE